MSELKISKSQLEEFATFTDPQNLLLAAVAKAALDAQSQLNTMVAENAYLMPKAASELSNAWVLNKYWVGIHCALMHMKVGRVTDAEEWLRNTVLGPGIDVPTLKLRDEIEAWALEQQENSLSHSQAMQAIKRDVPATDVILNTVLAKGVRQIVHEAEGYENQFGRELTSAEWRTLVGNYFSTFEGLSRPVDATKGGRDE